MKWNPKAVAITTAASLTAAALVAAPALASSEGQGGGQCRTQAEALACLDSLREYVLAHPDAPLPTPTPTAPAPTTSSPAPTTSAPTTSSPTPTTSAPTTSSPTPTTPAPTSTTVPAKPYASGLPWSSGAFTDHKASVANDFAAMRGRALDNISVFPSRESWSEMQNSWFLDSKRIPNDFQGDIVVGVPLWPENGSLGSNDDAQWKKFAQTVAAKDSDAIVRLGWEMNLPGWYFHITKSNQDQWAAKFNKSVEAMHSVAPNLRIAYNPNWGPDQTSGDSRQVFQKVKHNVDYYGIDMYDEWPPDTSDSAWQQRLNGAGGLQDSLNYAKANGKKFALPEWGVACNGSGCQWQGHAGGDNPRYVNNTLGFLIQNKAHVAFDSWFNEDGSYIKSNLVPTTTNPKAAAAYKAKLTEAANS